MYFISVLITALVITDCTYGGYVDPDAITILVQKYTKRFQSVVKNDVTNFTSIIQSLEKSKATSHDQQFLTKVFDQYLYSYKQFSNAVQYLMNACEIGIQNKDLMPNILYLSNSLLQENINLCHKTKTAVDQIISLLSDLRKNPSIAKLERETLQRSGVIALPRKLASKIMKADEKLGSLNILISQYLTQLVENVQNYVSSDRVDLRANQVVVPLFMYSEVMQILAKLCSELKVFQNILPSSVVVGKTDSKLLIDAEKEFSQFLRVLKSMESFYAITEEANKNPLQLLRDYGEPFHFSQSEQPNLVYLSRTVSSSIPPQPSHIK